MGFFSADCTGCDHPLLSDYAVDEINRWMVQGVTIFSDGSLIKGTYDGFGRYDPTFTSLSAVEGFESALEGTVWHAACWAVAGSPTDYRGKANPSADQGYFFADGAHDMSEPVLPAASGAPVVSITPMTDTEARLRTALGYLIVERNGQPKCERFTTGIGSCFTDAGCTADARYGQDQACASCIAHYALTDQTIVTGPGVHADE